MLAESLLHPRFDSGTEEFQATNMEITSVDTGNPAANVIPAEATASFNIRFNDLWTAETVMTEIESLLNRAAKHRLINAFQPAATGYRSAIEDANTQSNASQNT